VTELFAPPGTEWQGVSPRLATTRRLVLGAVCLVLLAAGVVLGLVLDRTWVSGAVVVVVLALFGFAWWVIGRNARWWGYAERQEDLYIRRGAMFRRLVVVPYGRMQFVDVLAGPVNQAFGLARVQLHTASPATDAHIPGLTADEAARLRDRLTSLGESRAAGL